MWRIGSRSRGGLPDPAPEWMCLSSALDVGYWVYVRTSLSLKLDGCRNSNERQKGRREEEEEEEEEM